MALSLENHVEEKTWSEWSDLMECFRKWRVKNTYYPHNMDLFDAKINEIDKQRRNSVQNVINERDNICLEYHLLNESEKSLIQEYSTKIKTGYSVYDFHLNDFDKLEITMQKIVNLQNERLEKLREMTRGRHRTEYIVPPSPMKKTLLNKKKEEKKELAKVRRQEKRAQEKSQPLRRSKRLIEKKYGTDFAYKYLVNYV